MNKIKVGFIPAAGGSFNNIEFDINKKILKLTFDDPYEDRAQNYKRCIGKIVYTCHLDDNGNVIKYCQDIKSHEKARLIFRLKYDEKNRLIHYWTERAFEDYRINRYYEYSEDGKFVTIYKLSGEDKIKFKTIEYINNYHLWTGCGD